MIDLDRLDRGLEQACVDEVRVLRQPVPPTAPAAENPWPVAAPAADTPAPAQPRPAFRPAAPARSRRDAPASPPVLLRQPCSVGPTVISPAISPAILPVVDLLSRGHLAEADRRIAGLADHREAASWSTMRALLDGRQADARAGLDQGFALAQEARSPGALDGWWVQRYWMVLNWGSPRERDEVLDHCRTMAYRHGEPGWWSALGLILARMGMFDESARCCDEAAARILHYPDRDGVWLDATTNLAEAAALMRDPDRAAPAYESLARHAPGSLVLAGPAWVCKGSIDRYWALAAAATGRMGEADHGFRAASDTHQALGARPLLARTMFEWGRSLAGYDDSRSTDCLRQALEAASSVRLTW